MTSCIKFKKSDQPCSRHLRLTYILSILTLLIFTGLSASPAHAVTGTDVSPGDACANEDAVMMSANPSGTGGYIMTCESSVWVATMSAGLPTANEHVANKEYVDTVAAAGASANGRFAIDCFQIYPTSGAAYGACLLLDTQSGQTACRFTPSNNSLGSWASCAEIGFSSMGGTSVAAAEPGDPNIYAANAYGWGGANQVGDGASAQSSSPKAIDLNLAFTKIVGGYYHACGIASNKPYCWGVDSWGGAYGNLGPGNSSNKVSPSPVNISSIGYPSVTDIESGHTKGAIRTSAGTWYGWGNTNMSTNAYAFGSGGGSIGPAYWYNASNVWEQLPNDFTKLAFQNYHMCALRSNGNIHCATYDSGSTSYSYRMGVANLGATTGCGVHTTWNWRRNLLGGCFVEGGHTFTDVAVNPQGACGVANDGEIYCWGASNSYGMFGNSSNPSNGTPTAVDKSISGAVTFEKVYGNNNAGNHMCALDTAGKAYCWGYNNYGQLGTGDVSNRSVPTAVLGNYTWDELSVGDAQTCGVSDAGTLYCWGYNPWGQLGNGSTSQKLIPEPVSGGSGYVGIVSTYQNGYAWK